MISCFNSYSLHICFVYPIQEKILFCRTDSLNGFSLAIEQKISYCPFAKKTPFLTEEKLPFTRAFSRTSNLPSAVLKEKFLSWLEIELVKNFKSIEKRYPNIETTQEYSEENGPMKKVFCLNRKD